MTTRLAALLIALSGALLPAAVFAQTTPADPQAIRARLEEIDRELGEIAERKAELDAKLAEAEPEEEPPAEGYQLPPNEYLRATVLSVEDRPVELDAMQVAYRVRLLSGDEAGSERTIVTSSLDLKNSVRRIEPGETIVVVRVVQIDGEVSYYLADNYRLPALAWFAAGFLALAALFGGKRGITSILGLAASSAIIVLYVVPKILSGGAPFRATLIGAFLIAAVSLFLAHGFSRRTAVAWAGTTLTLALTAVLATVAVAAARMSGTGSEEALFLLNGDFGSIDLRGLLLGGIVLGALGVLDDITTAQSAVVEELKLANPKFGFSELYRRGLSVGREHIASLVNTLFLAYAGASLPLFLLFSAYREQPAWFVLNGDLIAEEIVRTLVGSTCLILAVPITTALAAAVFAKGVTKGERADELHAGHRH